MSDTHCRGYENWFCEQEDFKTEIADLRSKLEAAEAKIATADAMYRTVKRRADAAERRVDVLDPRIATVLEALFTKRPIKVTTASREFEGQVWDVTRSPYEERITARVSHGEGLVDNFRIDKPDCTVEWSANAEGIASEGGSAKGRASVVAIHLTEEQIMGLISQANHPDAAEAAQEAIPVLLAGLDAPSAEAVCPVCAARRGGGPA
jgi:hypothetical protein